MAALSFVAKVCFCVPRRNLYRKCADLSAINWNIAFRGVTKENRRQELINLVNRRIG